MEFCKNGLSLIINKDKNEPDNIFYDRYWFIISQDIQKLDKLDELVKLSKIWVNMKYNRCKYSSYLADKAFKFSRNISRY
jgi:hypothetical protein